MAAVALCSCGWFQRRPREVLAWYSAMLHLLEEHFDEPEDSPAQVVLERPFNA